MNSSQSRPHRSRGGSRQRPSGRTRRADPVRTAAYRCLRAVHEDNAYANLALPKIIAEHRLVGRDAGMCTELAYGTLRFQGYYDAIVGFCSDRGVENIDSALLDVIRLGIHQLIAMRIPDHAAVDQTVGLARAEVGIGPSQFVNAVLRRVAEHSPEEWKNRVSESGRGPLEKLAAVQSHPVWVTKALRQALAAHGRSPDELQSLLEVNNTAPGVSLAVLPGLATAEQVFRELSELSGDDAMTPKRGALSKIAVGISHVPPAKVSVMRRRVARVQDEGSQLVAQALADAPLAGEDQKWLDLCAGPGGKSAVLAALAVQRSASLVAVEPQPHRAELVRQAVAPIAERASKNAIEVKVADGRGIGKAMSGQFDRVLVDAPCTGLGVLRRRPESRWRRTPENVTELVPLQKELLQSAILATRPGGVIAYVTCSPHPAETLSLIDQVLRADSTIELIPAEPVISSVLREGTAVSKRVAEGLPLSDKTVQLWPHLEGTDGMFLALFRKLSTS